MKVNDLDLDGAHWTYVLRFYALPGVAPACLHLQDKAGVDVLVLLISLYATQVLHRAIGPDAIAEMDAKISAWRRDIVHPLRELRQSLKRGPAPAPQAATERLREAVKKAELSAEQIELAALASGVDNLPLSSVRQDVITLINSIVSTYAKGADGDITREPSVSAAIRVIAAEAGAVSTPVVAGQPSSNHSRES